MEQPRGSDLYTDSQVKELFEDLPVSFTTFDQCMFGAQLADGYIKKATTTASNASLPELARRCDGGHGHVQLRGADKGGTRTAQAAVYPQGLCDGLCTAAERIHLQGTQPQPSGG